MIHIALWFADRKIVYPGAYIKLNFGATCKRKKSCQREIVEIFLMKIPFA